MREIDRVECKYGGTVLHRVSETDDITNYVGALSEADSPLGGEADAD